jgi:plasmid stability protein
LGRKLQLELDHAHIVWKDLCQCADGIVAIFLLVFLGEYVPSSLILKNMPDVVYQRLKVAAQMHHRSMSSEAIACLESALLPHRLAPCERLGRARELRSCLPLGQFTDKDIDAARRAGRQ